MSSEKSLTPQIRFKGFTEAWEQRKVFEIVNRLDNLRVPVASNLRIPGNTPYYGANGIQDYVSGFTHNGEFVLVAEDGANDLKNYPVHYVSGKIWVNNHAHVLQGLERVIDNRFLSFSLVHCDIEVFLVGGGRSKLNANTLMNELTLSLPNLNEQKNIGGLFFKLDDLITLHQRKLDALKKIKSALLEKMFPKNGSNVPEIRFTGFTEAWEQRKLGELMEVTSVRRVHQDEWTTQGVRFLRARDLVAYANNTEIELPLYISKELYEKYTAQSGKVEIGDLLVTGVGTIGVPWLVETPSPVYFKDGNIIWFKNKNAIYGKYFYYAFTSAFIQNFIKESAGTGTVGTYTIDTGKKTPIYIPPTFEQHKIASAMKRFDSLITLHQRKLDALKKIKSALLEKMFV